MASQMKEADWWFLLALLVAMSWNVVYISIVDPLLARWFRAETGQPNSQNLARLLRDNNNKT